ncbi:hypothetical protein BTO30_14095 [Domibacillus antri]|uniref:ABC-three component systems C-terminal domain-containing protein n=1 Tax=Domibacillus antri TaxID=1714264 RepID=A0A1Q8Q2M9_9BACI|nr:ABC-three component system protein [Domibacillus antri]OLN21609.1 hypothetical protein BTO30_14095 [Domibacillus antri]
MSTEFSANAQALGYLYQVRYALLMLLKSNPDSLISIERFDDVAFEKDGSPIELIQTKHHLSNESSLSNSSSDLWKTLRVWCTAFLNDESKFEDVKYMLITTNRAADDSAASKLYPSQTNKRDIHEAMKILDGIAEKSENKGNKKAYDTYLSLSDSQRKKLLSKVFILDNSPSILDTKDFILRELIYAARPQFVKAVYERLEGFWFNKAIEHLSLDGLSSISHIEVREFIHDLQEQFQQDNLPMDFMNIKTYEGHELQDEEKVFIEQLKLITVRQPRINKAISDYYKAYEQRSRWIRDELILVNELENYEDRLIDEWERRFETMLEDLGEESAEEVLQKEGRALFNWIDQQAEIPIRPKCTAPYILRGSYHMLSNKLQVGWHSMYIERLQDLYKKYTGGRNETVG